MRMSYSRPRVSARSASSAFFCFARKFGTPDIVMKIGWNERVRFYEVREWTRGLGMRL
jgi:hypothetical protein